MLCLSRLREICSVSTTLLDFRRDGRTIADDSTTSCRRNGNGCQISFVYPDVSVMELVWSNHGTRPAHEGNSRQDGRAFPSRMLSCTSIFDENKISRLAAHCHYAICCLRIVFCKPSFLARIQSILGVAFSNRILRGGSERLRVEDTWAARRAISLQEVERYQMMLFGHR